MPARLPRRLAAVMFTDIAGYTALMQEDEEGAVAARDRHHEVVGAAVRAHGGQVIQLLGDGALALFPSAVECVTAAIGIQHTLREPPAVPVRIGIHQGDVGADEHGIYGDAVNVAARLQALAPVGGVLISAKVRDEIRNRDTLPVHTIGATPLKNVREPVEIFALAAPGLALPASQTAPAQESTFLARVRSALAPQYEVEAEIGRGGAGVVFMAHDVTLRRRVAIKVIRPELATAEAVERFLREARLLAKLSHPNIIAIHGAGEARGLYYYVMDLVQGGTLADRLERGPLSSGHAVRVATDVLHALEAVHALGAVHRDVKPSNIHCVADRAVLGDFGVVALLAEASGDGRLTSTGAAAGTPAYMAPEQREGGAGSPATDIYATALVLYEALTGRGWYETALTGRVDWRGVPRPLRPALRRALDPSPAARFASAAEFKAALHRTRTRPMRAAATILVVGVAAATGYLLVRDPAGAAAAAPYDLAILPFQTGIGADSGFAHDLAHYVAINLQNLPQLSVAPPTYVTRWWRAAGGRADATGLRAVHRAMGSVIGGDTVEAILVIADSTGGQPYPAIRTRGPGGDPAVLANRIALALLDRLEPGLGSSYAGGSLGSQSLAARQEFLRGEHAFSRNAWAAAERHYREAVRLDTGFALAEARLGTVWRWRLTGRPGVDFEHMHATHREELPPPDRALLDAHVTREDRARMQRYEAAWRAFPADAYVTLLHADEVFHRGPLVGVPLERAAELLAEAGALDPRLSPVWEHAAWARIRLGQRDEALRAIEHLRGTAAPPDPADPVHFPALLEQAWLERFDPQQAHAQRQALFGGSSGAQTIGFAMRMGLSVDVPHTQIELAEMILVLPESPQSLRATAHYAAALGLLATGRGSEALRHLDAAAQDRSVEARLQAAEWRVLPAAFGVPLVTPEETTRGRAMLEALAADDAARPRAAWTLAADALLRRDTIGAARWARAARDDPGLLEVLRYEAVGRTRDALRLSEPLLDAQSQRADSHPFARAALHLARAALFESIGDTQAAARELVWAENQDIRGQLSAAPQAVEIDWVLGVHASYRRGSTANGGDPAACRQLRRVVRLWADADPALRELHRLALARAARCPAD